MKRSGFTLLELLIVVAILAALVALALPYYQEYVNQARITAAQADVRTFTKALGSYDQLEPTVYINTDLRGLIGRYLQDYRTNDAQTMPLDPWGQPYKLRIVEGTIVSGGPNRFFDTPVTALYPSADDVFGTWKPPFFFTAKALNATTVDIFFSRKIDPLIPIAAGALTVDTSLPVGPSTVATKISDTQWRFTVPTMTSGSSLATMVDGSATAGDGKVVFDKNPGDLALATGTATFTAP
ncbi:MAG: prepilin-type N-terminal cleavage/methylation domain-containing protein [Candidatus Ozemobacteraceae bacterium]